MGGKDGGGEGPRARGSATSRRDLTRSFPLGDGVADLQATASCPYCGSEVEIAVDPGGGAVQEYVEDCPVCCRPWAVTLRYDAEGRASVSCQAILHLLALEPCLVGKRRWPKP